jgi:hypothetical protein
MTMRCALRYAWNVVVLLAGRHITWRTALHGFRQRPVALAGRRSPVAGRQCSYVVDPDFD